MQRMIIILVAIVVVACVVLAVAGILRVKNTPDKINVTIDKKELQTKSEEAAQKTREVGKEILDKTSDALRRAGNRLEGTPQSQPAPGRAANSPQQQESQRGPGR